MMLAKHSMDTACARVFLYQKELEELTDQCQLMPHNQIWQILQQLIKVHHSNRQLMVCLQVVVQVCHQAVVQVCHQAVVKVDTSVQEDLLFTCHQLVECLHNNP